MQNTSPFVAMTRLETQLKVVIRQIDPENLELKEREALKEIRLLCTDARLDIRDYELSETRQEQLENAQEAQRRLKQLQAMILTASLAFSPADVAQLSAQLEQINEWLI